MTITELLLALLPHMGYPVVAVPSMPPVRAVGLATVFHTNDRDNPDITLGCVRAARRLGLRDLRDDLPVVAMREGHGARCGAVVYVEHAGRRTPALRLDSGPHGKHADGRYRAIVDLSPAVAAAIRLPGRGVQRRGFVKVRWW